QHPLPKRLIGRSPIYHGDYFCVGQYLQDCFHGGGKVMCSGGNRIVPSQFLILDPTCFDGRKKHRRLGERALSKSLDELGGWCAERDNEVGGSFRIERVQVIHKRRERRLVLRSGTQI